MPNLHISKRYDLIDMFNDTSRYIDDIFTIGNPEFEKHIPNVYPTELHLNKANTRYFKQGKVNWLFNVTMNDISVIYVTAHRCAGGLKKKCDLRSGSIRHRHFVGFLNVPVLAPTRDHPFYTVIPTHRPI